MSYLSKRKALLYPVMEKKLGVENDISKLKELREAEEVKLTELKALTSEVSKELADVRSEIDAYLGVCSEITEVGGQHVQAILKVIADSNRVLDAYRGAIEVFAKQVDQARSEVAEFKRIHDAAKVELMNEDKRLEVKRNDIRIYEDRLKKALKDAGMEDKISLIFV